MLYFMVASAHGGVGPAVGGDSVGTTALVVGLIIIAIIEANALWGKMNGAIQSVRGVITSSIVLTIIMASVTTYI